MDQETPEDEPIDEPAMDQEGSANEAEEHDGTRVGYHRAAEESSEIPAPQLAEPGIYEYAGDETTEHRLLGVLQPGEQYDFSTVVHEEMLEALHQAVEAGLLKKV